MAQQYTTGSATVTNGSTTVTGTGTDWQSAGITTGDWFIIQGDAIGYRINSVQSNTELTLSEPYAGTSGTYSDYGITREFTPNLALVEMAPRSIGSAQAYNESMGIIDAEISDRPTQAEADARYLNEASNLGDLPNAGTARSNLGLGTAAVADLTTGATDETGALRAEDAYAAGSKNWHDGNFDRDNGNITATFDSSNIAAITGIFDQSCTYVKIGDMVFIRGQIALSASSTTTISAGDNLTFDPSMLPYPAIDDALFAIENVVGCFSFYESVTNKEMASGTVIIAGNKKIIFFVDSAVNSPTVSDTTGIVFTATYQEA